MQSNLSLQMQIHQLAQQVAGNTRPPMNGMMGMGMNSFQGNVPLSSTPAFASLEHSFRPELPVFEQARLRHILAGAFRVPSLLVLLPFAHAVSCCCLITCALGARIVSYRCFVVSTVTGSAQNLGSEQQRKFLTAYITDEQQPLLKRYLEAQQAQQAQAAANAAFFAQSSAQAHHQSQHQHQQSLPQHQQLQQALRQMQLGGSPSAPGAGVGAEPDTPTSAGSNDSGGSGHGQNASARSRRPPQILIKRQNSTSIDAGNRDPAQPGSGRSTPKRNNSVLSGNEGLTVDVDGHRPRVVNASGSLVQDLDSPKRFKAPDDVNLAQVAAEASGAAGATAPANAGQPPSNLLQQLNLSDEQVRQLIAAAQRGDSAALSLVNALFSFSSSGPAATPAAQPQGNSNYPPGFGPMSTASNANGTAGLATTSNETVQRPQFDTMNGGLATPGNYQRMAQFSPPSGIINVDYPPVDSSALFFSAMSPTGAMMPPGGGSSFGFNIAPSPRGRNPAPSPLRFQDDVLAMNTDFDVDASSRIGVLPQSDSDDEAATQRRPAS